MLKRDDEFALGLLFSIRCYWVRAVWLRASETAEAPSATIMFLAGKFLFDLCDLAAERFSLLMF